MTMKLLSSVFAGILFIGVPAALAQDAVKPADPAASTDSMTTPAVPLVSTDAGEVGAVYLTEQGKDQVSANSYIGQTVYNAANESVGEIKDLILKRDGAIVAAVIGVGGFLGMGEKTVAVPITNIVFAQSTDGADLKLTTTETAESLKAAPEFKTLGDVAAETTGSISNGGTMGTTVPEEGVLNGAPPAKP